MESLEKPVDQPVGDKVLHAMAQAYPDPVDLYLLSMVMGCGQPELESTTAELVACGLARAGRVREGAGEHLDAPCITDKGMVVADGLARDAREADALLRRLEAAALRQLLHRRIAGSKLAGAQAEELHRALDKVSDADLTDAATVWAHQNVSDWRALVKVMGSAQ
ncbi:hypothetical protein [Piscinibacter terrae]|uniref:Uncharacterized protein n=1 Tax=Piscinibacter terrae TaxID=2496871 RepID=A0A3N7HJA2_9BURK|nr:hypothetical protein [Albitalea terrae]RQP22128.1 hypothetical protein DZC73_24290 [Albitalea terrae]